MNTTERESKARKEGEAAQGQPIFSAIKSDANKNKPTFSNNTSDEVSLDSPDSRDKTQEQVKKEIEAVATIAAGKAKQNKGRGKKVE